MNTSSLELRPLAAEHLDDVMTWVNDPDVVKNFQHFDRSISREEEAAFIGRLIASPNDRVFSIFRSGNGAYVGQTAVNQISWENKLGRLSLFIKPEHSGMGYAQHALGLLLEKAFGEFGLNKVWLMVWAENKKGLHIYEKLGFRQEGVLREEYFWQGEYHDIVRMGLLASEFSPGGPSS
ncbi:MAG TPA: GNAT family protein [Candidatus Paceibacterota bacterium]|nr:GNAT family protein [Candidatus Paceibacterota bacterium]